MRKENIFHEPTQRPLIIRIGNKKHNQYLTEFCLIIRLVYLWFATADWLFSCSEGVFPLQKQFRH